MAYSYYQTTATGTSQILSVPPYIDRSHISVLLDGSPTTSFSWLTDNTISITATAGALITVKRSSSPSARVTDYIDGVPLTERALDNDSLQAFYLAQEAADVLYTVPLPQANAVLGWDAAGVGLINIPAATGTSLVTLGSDTGSALVGHKAVGSGAPVRTVQAKLRESVSVLDFGAVGDGVTDDTAAIQAAINASYGKSLFFPKGTYLSSDLSVTQDIKFVGEQDTALFYKANGTNALVSVTGTSTNFASENITYNGNYSNQTGTVYSIRFSSAGTESSPSYITLENNIFTNGNYADVTIGTSATFPAAVVVRIENNTFINGVEGTAINDVRALNISSACNVIITGNYFGFGRTPTTYGRAGIVSFISGYSGTASRGVISDNIFHNMGRSSAASNGVLGAIDCYAGGVDLSIDGNSLINSYGRGIQLKSDSNNVVISNNSLNGLLDLTAGAAVDSLITINRSVTTTANGKLSIIGNVCRGSIRDGISVSCANTDFTASADEILVSNNIVDSSTRRGIGIYRAINAVLVNNIVSGGCSEYGIVANTFTGSSLISIDGNQVTGVTGNGIYLDTLDNINVVNNVLRGNTAADIFVRVTTKGLIKNNQMLSTTPLNTGPLTGITGVVIEKNITANAIDVALYRPEILSGAIHATFNFIQLNTEGGAATDDLDTINGGYEGMVLTLRTWSNSRDVVVKNGTGNLVMTSDFTLDTLLKTITFIKVGASWYEVSRSANV